MTEVRREITKEEYDKYTNMSKAEARKEIEKTIDNATLIGYGIYCLRFYKNDDKYYLIYDRGSSCD